MFNAIVCPVPVQALLPVFCFLATGGGGTAGGLDTSGTGDSMLVPLKVVVAAAVGVMPGTSNDVLFSSSPPVVSKKKGE